MIPAAQHWSMEGHTRNMAQSRCCECFVVAVSGPQLIAEPVHSMPGIASVMDPYTANIWHRTCCCLYRALVSRIGPTR